MAWLTNWSKRQKLTLDHTVVDADCSNFPLKVIVPATNPLFGTAKPDGADVRFTSSDGETTIDFEREVHVTPDLWYQFSGSSVPPEFSVGSEISSATVTDGKLVLVPNSDCWDDYANACVELDVNLTGDFDIQVDLEWVGQSDDQAEQYLQIVTASEYVGIGMRDVWVVSDGMISVLGDTAGHLYSGEPGDLTESGSANLRIYRDGTTVYFLWNGAQKASYSCSDTVTSLRLTNTMDIYENKTAKWDNLMIFDSAGNLNMSSYSSEAKDLSIAVYHVEVPLVSSTSDTDIYLYYGNASATDASSPSDVWDSDYELVMHMDSSLEDSTSNSNDGTNHGSGLGLASDGYYRSFDGTDDYISLPDVLGGLADVTVEVYVRHAALDADHDILTKGNHESSNPFVFWRDEATTDSYQFLITDSNADYSGVKSSATTPSTDPIVLSLVFDGGVNASLFVDGVEDGNSPWDMSSIQQVADTVDDTQIGNDDTPNKPFDGDFYEVRISSIARSDAWIKATAESLADNLVTFGSEESASVTRTQVMVVWA